MYSLFSLGFSSLLTSFVFLTGCVRYSVDSPEGRDRILNEYSIQWAESNKRSIEYYRLLGDRKVNEARELSKGNIALDLEDARASLKRLQLNENGISSKFYPIITNRLNVQIREMERVLK